MLPGPRQPPRRAELPESGLPGPNPKHAHTRGLGQSLRVNHLTGFIGWTLRACQTQRQIHSGLILSRGRGHRHHFRIAHGQPHTSCSSAQEFVGTPVPRTTGRESRVMAAPPTPWGAHGVRSRARARSQSPGQERGLLSCCSNTRRPSVPLSHGDMSFSSPVGKAPGTQLSVT